MTSLNLKHESARLLKRALVGNALFSGICGGIIVLADSGISALLGLEGLSLWPIGAMLLAFSAYLFWMSRARTVPAFSVWGVIFSDWAWVVGTALLLLLNSHLFSRTGILLLIDVAIVVAAFALFQTRGLNRVVAHPGPGHAR